MYTTQEHYNKPTLMISVDSFLYSACFHTILKLGSITMKGWMVMKKLITVIVLLFASASAFASSCNGIKQVISNAIEYEVSHASYHAEMFWYALSTGNFRLYMEMTVCSANGVLSMLLFHPAGWALLIAMYFGFVFVRKQLRLISFGSMLKIRA